MKKLKSPFKFRDSNIKITTAGWIYILITILLGVAGINTGNNLVYMIVSAMLSFIGISGFIAKVNLSGLKIYLEFPKEVFAGKPSFTVVRVLNKKRFFPSFLISVHINDEYLIFPYINSKEKKSGSVRITFPRRGLFSIESIKICSVFPFRFFIRCKSLKLNEKVLVFPKPIRYEAVAGNKGKRKKYSSKSRIKSYEGEVGGFSNYYKGVPIKYISWKHLAKLDKLIVKDMYSDEVHGYIIDIDEFPKVSLEKRLSFATYIILNMFKKKIPVGLKLGKKFFPPSLSYKHKIAMLSELARYNED